MIQQLETKRICIHNDEDDDDDDAVRLLPQQIIVYFSAVTIFRLKLLINCICR